MTKRDKLRQRIEQNPKAVAFEELDQLLRSNGFQLRQTGRGSSHFYYKRGRISVSVPRRRPHLLPIYVKLALAAIDKADEEETDE